MLKMLVLGCSVSSAYTSPQTQNGTWRRAKGITNYEHALTANGRENKEYMFCAFWIVEMKYRFHRINNNNNSLFILMGIRPYNVPLVYYMSMNAIVCCCLLNMNHEYIFPFAFSPFHLYSNR